MARSTARVRLLAAALVGAAGWALIPAPAWADPDLEQRLDAASRQLAVVVEEYNELREDLRLTTAQTGVLANQIAPLEGQVEALTRRIGVIADTAYRTHASTDPFVLLLKVGAGDDLIDRLLLLEHLARDQQREIAELTAARERYDAARRTLSALADQQREQEATLAAKRDRIEAKIADLRALRDAAGVPAVAPVPVHLGQRPPTPDGAARTVIEFAYAQLGKAYQWAGEGPDAYDCSGLTKMAWAAAGVDLPHNSRRQWEQARRLARDQLVPGDLVFYYDDIHHVALYLGAGLVVHAPGYGQPVRIAAVDHAPVHGFGRVA